MEKLQSVKELIITRWIVVHENLILKLSLNTWIRLNLKISKNNHLKDFFLNNSYNFSLLNSRLIFVDFLLFQELFHNSVWYRNSRTWTVFQQEFNFYLVQLFLSFLPGIFCRYTDVKYLEFSIWNILQMCWCRISRVFYQKYSVDMLM